MILEECPLVAVVGTLGEGCDITLRLRSGFIFPEHKTEHLFKPGKKKNDFVEMLQLKVCTEGFLDFSKIQNPETPLLSKRFSFSFVFEVGQWL